MKLLSVVCRVEDDSGRDVLHNIEPATFLDLLSAAAETQDEPDDMAALQAELDAARSHNAPANPKNAVPEGASFNEAGQPYLAPAKLIDGFRIVARAEVEPIMQAKTRGELYEKIDALLAQFNARIAREGE